MTLPSADAAGDGTQRVPAPTVAAAARNAAMRTIEAFVLRARRVAAHSLAQDADRLEALARGEIQIVVRGGEPSLMCVALPPEEQTESAAARVRPIFLERDPCYYQKTLKALGVLLEGHPVRARLREIRKIWEARLNETRAKSSPGVITMIEGEDGSSLSLTNVELALGWIYGDVVHHDLDRRTSTEEFSVRLRYKEAVPLVAFAILHTVGLLGLIETLATEGALKIDPEVFTVDVVVPPGPLEFPIEAAYSAPVGTSLPSSVDEPFGAEWEREL